MDEQILKKGRKKAAVCPPEMIAVGACGACGGACGGSVWNCRQSCPLGRWFLGIIILALVFWCGMQIGALKAELRAGGFSDHGVYNRFQTVSYPADQTMMFGTAVPARGTTAPAVEAKTAE